MRRLISLVAGMIGVAASYASTVPAVNNAVQERPAAPGRKPSGVRAARRTAEKRRNRARSK